MLVRWRGGRRLSDSTVSPFTSPHFTAHVATGFLLLSAAIHPGFAPGSRLQGQVRTGQRPHCGEFQGRAMVLEVEEQGSRPSPRPKTLIWLARRPTEGPQRLGTTSGQEGRQRLEVSAAVMAVARLRPSLRISTMEDVYNRARTHTHRQVHAHTHTHRLYSALPMSPIRGRKA